MSNKNYYDPIERMALYFDEVPCIDNFPDPDDEEFNDILDYDEYETPITIKLLSELYNIPVSVIRYDFITMINSYKKANVKKCKHAPIRPYEVNTDKMSVSEVINDIKSGNWDELPLTTNFAILNEEHYVPLTAEEYSALKAELQFVDGVSSFTSPIPFKVKKNYRYYDNPSQLYDTLRIINEAINEKLQVVFRYKNNKSKSNTSFIQTTPLKIIYDNEENLYHLLASKSGNYVVYSIANMLPCQTKDIKARGYVLHESKFKDPYDVFGIKKYNIFLLKAPAQPYNEDDLKEKIPHVWKNAFEQKKATHIKVKFKEEAYSSVLKDLELRNPEGKLSQIKDGYFYYEDDIYGIDAFDMWIRGYGSKAVILQPKELARKRIESIKQALENYS